MPSKRSLNTHIAHRLVLHAPLASAERNAGISAWRISASACSYDRISLNLHPLSKQAKEMGSAAQMVALLMIALTWTIILLRSTVKRCPASRWSPGTTAAFGDFEGHHVLRRTAPARLRR